MSKSVSFVFDNESPDMTQDVVEGLHQFNVQFLGEYGSEKIQLFALDENEKVVGGFLGNVLVNWLYVDVMWIHEDWRGERIGATLMEKGMAKAGELGATRAYLDTMQFQAAPFYEKLGFRELMRFEKFANGYDRIVMVKDPL